MSGRRMLLVVVTGLSGAGKTTALRALEDLGFYCVDNLPTPVVPSALAACATGGVKRLGLGIDVRVRSFLEDAAKVLDEIATSTREVSILFLDASDEALLRRFSTTRRPHPLSTTLEPGGEQAASAVLDGVRLERERLAPLRARAEHVVDTTEMSVHELRRRVLSLYGPGAGQQPRMHTRFVSFGFKYGTPVDADLVLDVRFLRNPYFVDELRDLAGTEAAVREFVLADEHTRGFVDKAMALLEFCLPKYEAEGKSYLTLAIGCTGGRHRSVVLADHLASRLEDATRLPIDVVHRDVDRVGTEGRRTDPDLIGGGPRGGGGAA